MKTVQLEGESIRLVTGIIPESLPLALIAHRIRGEPAPLTCVLCPTIAKARQWMALSHELHSALLPAHKASLKWALLPASPPVDPDQPIPERIREDIECDRANAFDQLGSQIDPVDSAAVETVILFSTPEAITGAAPDPRKRLSRQIRLTRGTLIDFENFKHRLAAELDYDNEVVCDRPGQFAIRGGLIDVYPLNGYAPVRIDFFGDEVDSLHSFDPTSQRRLKELDSITLIGRAEEKGSKTGGEGTRAVDWFGPSMEWICIHPGEMVRERPDLFEQFERNDQIVPPFAKLWRSRAHQGDRWSGLCEFEAERGFFPLSSVQDSPAKLRSMDLWRSRPLEDFSGSERLEAETAARKAFARQLETWCEEGFQLVLAVKDTSRHSFILDLLRKDGFKDPGFVLLEVEIPSGVLCEDLPKELVEATVLREKCAIVTERELLGRHPNRRTTQQRRLLPTRSKVDELLDFSDLANGDPLVHLAHGICLFRGLNRMAIRENEEDVISLEFADGILLHIALRDAHLLTRYVGLSKHSPKLAKLGSGGWEKTRAAAEKATLDFASELLNLQAQRTQDRGHAFSPDNEWMRAFEAAFPYKETRDQLTSIQATKADMEQPRPMDRLLCGDVGFGKTEVAIRAAFKAVLDGFQVAILVPTTILAQQHFETFRERFSPYPVTVEMLSRFRTKTEQDRTVQSLREGKVDIVIGTHRLFSKDVQFKRLGVLVVDEEHRFGVRHKEKLKRFRNEVDVLTMSATPIPRTLYLALMGARDLSVIETPPADRLPIETIVRQYDPQLVANAIQRELDRGGQVFYLHNRVQTIDSVAAKLNEWVPKARIGVGHGQMAEAALERLMTRFVAGQLDVLVCTTIIENGLDIPNCNTIIIEGADRFGLSQLYQLRGRVGRFNRQAYAYLLLHRHSGLVEVARKRLSAMRQYNQLGAGFQIAMRDLELRGAGNLLGFQQSGHISGVGFDLYCQLLRQSISRQKGEPLSHRIHATVNLDFIADSPTAPKAVAHGDFAALVEEELAEGQIQAVAAEIPENYISDPRLRIDFYRQMAMAGEINGVDAITEAMEDRFGKLPIAARRLSQIARIRVRAEIAGIQSVECTGNRLKCRLARSGKIEFIQQSGRFPRLTGHTADLRLREIEHFLARQCPKSPS